MISAELRHRIAQVTAKRPRTVLEHILRHGYVTTDELKQLYGYNHPPRAARDVRELGIPLITKKVTGPDGRKIAEYRLPTAAEEAEYRLPTAAEEAEGKASGRRAFSKAFKRLLLDRDGERCAICSGMFPGNILQIDHNVPYEVGGDPDGERNPDAYMLLCPSCNRTKSWTCEQCPNWLTAKDAATCTRCLLGSPTDYSHIATTPRRRLTLDWSAGEVGDFDRLKREADAAGQSVEQFAKGKLVE